MAKKVEVLLLKPLPPKGNAGDVIEVKIHFASQVLIPQGIAIIYDKQAKNQHQAQLKKIEKNKVALQQHVTDMLSAIQKDGVIKFEKAATEKGTLYDSINAKSIAQYIADTYKVRLSADHYQLDTKIEEIGEYEVIFQYEDIKSTIPVAVVAKA